MARSKYKKGYTFDLGKYGEVEVLEYKDMKNVKVRFNATGYITTAITTNLTYNCVKDPYYKSVTGVGFLGEGLYLTHYVDSGKPTSVYSRWHGMLWRCYSEKGKESTPTYKGCTVCASWHNFQNYAMWYYNNIKEGYELDKDLLVKGNKTYSPETCIGLPAEINTFLTDRPGRLKVYTRDGGKSFLTYVSNPYTKKMDYFGTYSEKVHAELVFDVVKYVHAKSLADVLLVHGEHLIAKALLEYYKDCKDLHLPEGLDILNIRALRYIDTYIGIKIK